MKNPDKKFADKAATIAALVAMAFLAISFFLTR